MRAEQVIYTSCKKGIKSDTSGFQIYSYSECVEQWIGHENHIGVMMSYQPPGGDRPPLPTIEQAQTLFPKRWCYNQLAGPDKLGGLFLNSYIGRDYPEGSQRAGNFLSHGAVFPLAELDDYPCRYIGSPSLKSWIDPENFRRDGQPAPLAPLNPLEHSQTNSLEAVQSFLSDENTALVYSQMLACLLGGNARGGGRIIIKDGEERFVLWLTALQMALPLRLGAKIAFSTYEYDPFSAQALVVRAVDDTAYSPTMSANSADAVFDFENGIFPDITFDQGDDFCDFVINAFAFSPESLKAFHDYLDTTSYNDVDERILSAYDLCMLQNNTLSMNDFSSQQLEACAAFSLEFCDEMQHHRLLLQFVSLLLSQAVSDETRTVLLRIFAAGGKKYSSIGQSLRENLLHSMVCSLEQPDTNYELFMQTLNIAKELYEVNGDNFNTEFIYALKQANTDNILPEAPMPWKIALLVKVAAVALDGESPPANMLMEGQFETVVLSGSVRCMVGQTPQQAERLLAVVMDAFAFNSVAETKAFIVIGRNLDAYTNAAALRDMCNAIFYKYLDGIEPGRTGEALRVLCENGMEGVVFNYLERSNDSAAISSAMETLPQTFVRRYGTRLLQHCYSMIGREGSLFRKMEILELARKVPGVEPQFQDQLMLEIIQRIPLNNASSNQANVLLKLMKMLEKDGKRPNVRMLACATDCHLRNTQHEGGKMFSSKKKLHHELEELMQRPLSLSGLSTEDLNTYLATVAPVVADLMQKSGLLALQMDLFDLPRNYTEFFVSTVLENIFIQLRSNRDYNFAFAVMMEDMYLLEKWTDHMCSFIERGNVPVKNLNKHYEKNIGDIKVYYARLSGKQHLPESYAKYWAYCVSHYQKSNKKGGLFGKK